YLVPDICEPGPSQRFLHDGLLFQGSYSISATGTNKDRGPEKTAAWVKPPVTFRDAFATHAGCTRRPVVWHARLRPWLRRRQALLCDPGNKNANDPVTCQGQER